MKSLQKYFAEYLRTCDTRVTSVLIKSMQREHSCHFPFFISSIATKQIRLLHQKLWLRAPIREDSNFTSFLLLLSSRALGNQQLMIGQHLSKGRIKGQAHVGKCQEGSTSSICIQELGLFIATKKEKDSTSPCLWPNVPCYVLASRDGWEGWMSSWPLTTCLC